MSQERRRTRGSARSAKRAKRAGSTRAGIPYITRRIPPYELASEELLELIESNAPRLTGNVFASPKVCAGRSSTPAHQTSTHSSHETRNVASASGVIIASWSRPMDRLLCMTLTKAGATPPWPTSRTLCVWLISVRHFITPGEPFVSQWISR